MTSAMRVSIDTAAVSPSKTIAEAARAVPLMALSGRLFDDLVTELGSMDAAMRHLLRVSENVNKPIAVNFSTGAETSTTTVIAPRSWTQTRLKGWIGAKHEALEAAFGPATLRESI